MGMIHINFTNVMTPTEKGRSMRACMKFSYGLSKVFVKSGMMMIKMRRRRKRRKKEMESRGRTEVRDGR